MEKFWTWRKIILFLAIIGVGIMGLMIADQQSYLQGRDPATNPIGNGEADPLIINNKVNQANPAGVLPTGIDGFNCDRKSKDVYNC